MTESDCEIEFLDEDAEIVQQCVQSSIASAVNEDEKPPPLLVERTSDKPIKRRRRKEDDSDYDPSEDVIPRGRKRKSQIGPRQYYSSRPSSLYIPKKPTQDIVRYTRKYSTNKKEEVLDRKALDIRIPDYDDPLCLPVKAIKKDLDDLKRLRNWNNLCLNQFKKAEKGVNAESGAKSSQKTVVLRNVRNEMSGKVETTVWSETSVENAKGKKKSEVLQCVLPRFREKKILNFQLSASKRQRPFHNVYEAVLTKEDSKEGERLVVYKCNEALSCVYKYITDENSDINNDGLEKKCLREITCCKICAPCYQVSWRGVRKNDQKNIRCPICMRTFVSVYNLLTHIKLHPAPLVQKHKLIISKLLSKVVTYHYECRICQRKFISIKSLRKHVLTHQGNEMFICEIGNHRTR